MKVLDFGSMNIDHTYHVPHFVRAGETIACRSYDKNVGGKGLNQAVALARAGVRVYMAGAIGADGRWLTDFLQEAGVDTSLVNEVEVPTGHALIQVDEGGANSIIIHNGANGMITEAMIKETISRFDPGDYCLLQNEISNVDLIIREAASRGLQVVLNPSPISERILQLPLNQVNWFILNEIEGKALTKESEPEKIIEELIKKYPKCRVVLTLGEQGAWYGDKAQMLYQPAFPARAVDTTGAGDTFTGFFLAAYLESGDIRMSLRRAAAAAAIAVGRKGAAAAIPKAGEVHALYIRKAQMEDFERIMEIYRIAQDFMIASGNPYQWGHFSPQEERIRQDIKEQISYLVCDGDQVHGVTALCEGADPTYAYIENGTWISDTPYVTIHRTAGDQQIHGILECVVEYCRGRWDHIRADTHADNKVMQHALTKCGFDRRGIIYLENGSPRIAYEWIKG